MTLAAGLSGIFVLWMARIPPCRYGDGQEYFFMTESLAHHASPELRISDIALSTPSPGISPFGEKYNDTWTPYFGYYQAPDGRWYSGHFFAYPLLCLPARAVLAALKADTRKAMQVTNAFLFGALLFCIVLSGALSSAQKLLAMALAALSPMVWFIHWTHAEVYLHVTVFIALLLALARRPVLSIWVASLAALQNQALVFLVALLALRGLASRPRSWRSTVGILAGAAVSLLCPLHFWTHFGRASLIASSSLVPNGRRMLELLLDLNIGALPYLPVTLLLYFGVTAWALWAEGRRALEAQVAVALAGLLAICSTVENWNHGTFGPSRYVIWICPLLFMPLLLRAHLLWRRSWTRVLLLTVVATQAWVTVGGLTHRPKPFPTFMNNHEHSKLARWVLAHAPSLYRPDFAVFCERTLGAGGPCLDPTVFRIKGQCRKAALTCAGLDALIAQCGAPHDRPRCLPDDKLGWFFIDY